MGNFEDWIGLVDSELLLRFAADHTTYNNVDWQKLFDNGLTPIDAVNRANRVKAQYEEQETYDIIAQLWNDVLHRCSNEIEMIYNAAKRDSNGKVIQEAFGILNDFTTIRG
jgi:hypothetical protein